MNNSNESEIIDLIDDDEKLNEFIISTDEDIKDIAKNRFNNVISKPDN